MTQNNREFNKLKNKWYRILKKEGFKDIEQSDGNLKDWASTDLLRPTYHHSSRIQAKEEYYRRAGHFLHDYTEFTDRSKLIWEFHAEGMTLKDMVIRMNSLGYKIKKSWVNKIIQDLAKIMIKKYEGVDYDQE